MGMVQGAVYDAVNAIGPKQHQPYLLKRRTGARASVDAAVATAAYDVLSELVSTAPDERPFPGRAGLLSTLSAEYAASLAAIDDGAFKKQGIAIGHAAAAAMLEAREGDGRFGPSPWVPNPAAGHWQPLLNATGQPILDPTPWAGNVKPFLIQSSSQFRTAPPPALDSAQWAAEFNEVKSLGRATGSTRTTSRRTSPSGGRAHPVLSWNEVARQLIARNRPRRRRQRQAPRAAEPERGGRGDQLLERQVPLRLLAAVERDPTSGGGRQPAPRIPTRPGRRSSPRRIPSGPRGTTASTPHTSPCCGCSSATTPWRAFQITSTFVNPGGPAVRTFDTFSQPLTELIEARIWAGLHYRSADVAGPAARPERGQLRDRELLPAGRPLTIHQMARHNEKARSRRAFSTSRAALG